MDNLESFESFLNEKEWKYTIDLSDIWSDEVEFSKELAKQIYDRIQSKIDEIGEVLGETEASHVSDYSEYIRDSSDEEEFDENMGSLYDWADDNDVWVKTSV